MVQLREASPGLSPTISGSRCDRFVELLSLTIDSPITSRRAGTREIRVYEHSSTGAREVLLTGPDEHAMRSLLDRAREAGGFSFQH